MGEEDENGCVIFRRAELFKKIENPYFVFCADGVEINKSGGWSMQRRVVWEIENLTFCYWKVVESLLTTASWMETRTQGVRSRDCQFLYCDQHYDWDWAIGRRLETGIERRFFCALAWVKDMNPPKLIRIPKTPVLEMGLAKIMLVTTIAKIRRIQLSAAWWTTDIRESKYVEAKL